MCAARSEAPEAVAGHDLVEDLRVGLPREGDPVGGDRTSEHVGQRFFHGLPSDAVRVEDGAVDVEEEQLH